MTAPRPRLHLSPSTPANGRVTGLALNTPLETAPTDVPYIAVRDVYLDDTPTGTVYEVHPADGTAAAYVYAPTTPTAVTIPLRDGTPVTGRPLLCASDLTRMQHLIVAHPHGWTADPASTVHPD